MEPKGRGQGIIVSNFLLLFGHLNIFSLFEGKRKEVMEKIRLTIIEAVELFEYKKANERYWDRSKFHKQVVNKILPLAKTLYPGYFCFCLKMQLVILCMHRMFCEKHK